jgi:hypothetical protein
MGGNHGGGGDRAAAPAAALRLRRGPCCGEGGGEGRGARWRGDPGASFIGRRRERKGRARRWRVLAGRPSFGRQWTSSAAARVGEGEEEDMGARERTKGQLRAFGCAFIGRGGERGLRPEVMAINGHGGRRPSMHSRERLEWRGNRRS